MTLCFNDTSLSLSPLFSGSHLITAANFCMNGKLAVVGTYDGRCIFYETEVMILSNNANCFNVSLFFSFTASEVSHTNTCQIKTR